MLTGGKDGKDFIYIIVGVQVCQPCYALPNSQWLFAGELAPDGIVDPLGVLPF